MNDTDGQSQLLDQFNTAKTLSLVKSIIGIVNRLYQCRLLYTTVFLSKTYRLPSHSHSGLAFLICNGNCKAATLRQGLNLLGLYLVLP